MSKPYSKVLIALLKGIVYSHDEEIWDTLLLPENEIDIKRYFADINLDVIIDKAEGYAYLKQQASDADDSAEEEKEEAAKLMNRRPLGFYVSLLCLLLRKHLIENDQEGDSIKAILSKEEIIASMSLYLKETSNEANLLKQVETAIHKVEKEGFLRKMKTEKEQYEINRIIKAFVNADRVSAWLEKYKEYAKQSKK